MLRRVFLLAALPLALACAGCGGGGAAGGVGYAAQTALASDDDAAGLNAGKGLWVGTTSTNRTIAGLLLPDGRYYVIYSVVGDPSHIAGVTQGTASESGNSVTSSDGLDFNFEGLGLNSGTVTATAIAKTSLVGAVTYRGGSTVQFTATYDADFDATPTLAALAGSYSGQAVSSVGVQSGSVIITSAGAFSSSSAGCQYSGSVAPRSDANVFDLRVTFGGAPCLFAGQTLTGIAYFDIASHQLIALAPNAARTDGFLIVGVKQ